HIAAGEDWYARLDSEIRQAKIAVLLVSATFITSEFIRSEEIPRLFEKHESEGMILFPILIKPCPYKQVKWLARMQLRPRSARPISKMRVADREQALSEIAEEILGLVRFDANTEEEADREEKTRAEEHEMETQFINTFNDYCEHCSRMMSRATGEVRTVQTPSRNVGDSRAFHDYLNVTADKIVRPSGPPDYGVSLYRRLVVV